MKKVAKKWLSKKPPNPDLQDSEKVAKQWAKHNWQYWKERVFKQAFTRDGKTIQTRGLAIRIQHAGKRETFQLGTTNRTDAGKMALERYEFLKANGWGATLEKYKSGRDEVDKDMVATVGQVIAEVERVSDLKARTLNQYASSLRQIAGEITGFSGGTERYSYRTKAYTQWREKIDGISIEVLTGHAVSEWRARRISEKGNDPMARARAQVSCSSVIRQARSLFGAKFTPLISRRLNLPDPLPFTGVILGKSAKRFVPTVDPEDLFADAESELKADHPEQFKALVLCLMAGLRRAEADNLTWEQIDFESGTIRIEDTLYFSPKSEEARRTINLSEDAMTMVKGFAEEPLNDPTFVLKGGGARPDVKYSYVRANKKPWFTWRQLTAWLKAKGVKTNKPVHALRKHAGSIVFANYGIEDARAFLGHSDIGTTSASYVSKRKTVVTIGRKETKR